MVTQGLNLYQGGWFPMADESGEVQWVQPHRRAIVPLDDRFHISRSLRKTLRRCPFVLSTDLAFERVIRQCATVPRPEGGTWLVGEIIELFDLFHRAGAAHSVEVWKQREDRMELVGGVYGLAVGRVFCAESMFCLPEQGGTDASKVALVALRQLVLTLGFSVLDAQMLNPHTQQFGTYDIDRSQYLESLHGQASRGTPAWPGAGPVVMPPSHP